MDYGAIFQKIESAIEPFAHEGKVSAYIPQLAEVNAQKFGIHLIDAAENNFCMGDSAEKFSIQSRRNLDQSRRRTVRQSI